MEKWFEEWYWYCVEHACGYSPRSVARQRLELAAAEVNVMFVDWKGTYPERA